MNREKCSYANKYKGIRKPTCGCKYCNEFYKKKLREKSKSGEKK